MSILIKVIYIRWYPNLSVVKGISKKFRDNLDGEEILSQLKSDRKIDFDTLYITIKIYSKAA